MVVSTMLMVIYLVFTGTIFLNLSIFERKGTHFFVKIADFRTILSKFAL